MTAVGAHGRAIAAVAFGFGLAVAVAGGRANAADEPRPTAGGDATNTGLNQRDRNESAKTPTDQGESAADRDMTARIRRELTSDDSLSMNAHNIKIITENGKVTLRGPVDSEAEKQKVVSVAQKVAPGKVVVELDVAAKR